MISPAKDRTIRVSRPVETGWKSSCQLSCDRKSATEILVAQRRNYDSSIFSKYYKHRRSIDDTHKRLEAVSQRKLHMCRGKPIRCRQVHSHNFNQRCVLKLQLHQTANHLKQHHQNGSKSHKTWISLNSVTSYWNVRREEIRCLTSDGKDNRVRPDASCFSIQK